ncbi:hypothetical protein OI67_04945 [Helicobacter pylori]|nr:hypothetical protein OI67_04945 [Helicobacter pylori]
MHVYNYISFLKTSFKKFFNFKQLKQVIKAKKLLNKLYIKAKKLLNKLYIKAKKLLNKLYIKAKKLLNKLYIKAKKLSTIKSSLADKTWQLKKIRDQAFLVFFKGFNI